MPEQQNPALRIEQVPLDRLSAIAASGELYAVADACDAPAVPKKVLELGPERAVSLYRGTAEEEFWEVAPYLMRVDPSVLDWILSTLDMTRWGIFAVSKADLKTLRTHFRHFLKIKSPEAEIWHFRFYDPRVLKLFLPVCTGEELRSFYGPVVAVCIADPELKMTSFFQEKRMGHVNEAHYSFMFQMRERHVEALKIQGDLSFAEEVIVFLKKMHSQFVKNLSDDELRRRVLFGLGRAEQYGFEQESSFAGFVAIMFRIGPNFDQHPSIHRVLTDPLVPPDLRISDLWTRTSDRDWEEAVSLAQKSVWK